MPVKEYVSPSLGKVKLYKRRGNKAIKITITADNDVRVSLPVWLPYRAGVEFVRQKETWVKQHLKDKFVFETGTKVGKAHCVNFVSASKITKPRAKVKSNEISVVLPAGMTYQNYDAQRVVSKAAEKVLRAEAQTLLPVRLKQLAAKHDFRYSDVSIKKMKSRWGSCSHKKDISLNLFLMQLDWQLIDYVLLHELTHTQHLNHGRSFWARLTGALPAAQILRKKLKAKQPGF